MEFGLVQRTLFNAVAGAYSLVTAREIYDSQITATDAEAALLADFYAAAGKPIHCGNVNSNPAAAAKAFRLWPGGERIFLNLVYPKPGRTELRLYLSKHRGFFPAPGDVWFVFEQAAGADLWLGAMPERQWRRMNSFGRDDEPFAATPPAEIDAIDAALLEREKQAEKEAAPAKRQERPLVAPDPETDRLYRSRDLALARMRKSRYKCEYDPAHRLFIAKATGCPYLEVHHLIPLRFQPQLPALRLDALDNLCCLCPNCHRAIHHAEDAVVKAMLARLAEIRGIGAKFRDPVGLLERFYAVEEITR